MKQCPICQKLHEYTDPEIEIEEFGYTENGDEYALCEYHFNIIRNDLCIVMEAEDVEEAECLADIKFTGGMMYISFDVMRRINGNDFNSVVAIVPERTFNRIAKTERSIAAIQSKHESKQ